MENTEVNETDDIEEVNDETSKEVKDEVKEDIDVVDEFVEIQKSELQEMKERITFLEDRHIRDIAENENFRKRMQEEKLRSIDFATSDVLATIIPTLDNFSRALSSKNVSADVLNFLKGFEMIKTGLISQLDSLGLVEVVSLGETFDANKHHAVSTACNLELEDDVILEELQKGYQYKNKIVRPAMVVVNKKEAAKNE